MLSAEDANWLALPLLEGLGQEPLWATFVERLQHRLAADYASIVFRPIPFGQPQSRIVHLCSGRESPPFVAQLYRERLHKEDPLPYFGLAEGRVHALSELLCSDDPAHEAYRRRLLEPSGMNIMRILRVEEPDGISAWLTVSRETGEFSREADSLLANLVPWLRAGLGAYMLLERERTKAVVAGEAIRRLAFGWLTLDARGRVLDADPQAAGLLAEGRVLLRGWGGQLVARDGEVSRAIAEAVSAMAGNAHARPRAIVISHEPWLDMLLVPASQPDAQTAGPAPALVAYVHADNWSSADRCEQLGQMFDLIPSEARLALALSRGMSIVEAASELGITVESARTYSKRIYAKTGARGQADLVRFIHRSVLAIA